MIALNIHRALIPIVFLTFIRVAGAEDRPVVKIFKQKTEALIEPARTYARRAISAYDRKQFDEEEQVLQQAVIGGSPEVARLMFDMGFPFEMRASAKALALIKTQENAKYLIDKLEVVSQWGAPSMNTEGDIMWGKTLMKIEESICDILDLKLKLTWETRVPIDVFKEALSESSGQKPPQLASPEKTQPSSIPSTPPARAQFPIPPKVETSWENRLLWVWIALAAGVLGLGWWFLKNHNRK
jgi:hypothetical protein